MRAGARDAVAVIAALAVYQRRVVPQVRAELGRWRGVAESIPDPLSRRLALAAIDEKGLNVEATAVFATLAPRSWRPGATRAMVSLQVAVDYLDTIGERPPEEQGSRGDADYLQRLFGAYREGIAALPSAGAVEGALDHAIARCGEGQARTHAAERGDRVGQAQTHAAEHGAQEGQAQSHAAERPGPPGPSPQAEVGGLDETDGPGALEAWARSLGAPGIYRWWEVAAGASSSVAAHALIAVAADPRTTTAEAEAIDAAYALPIGALTVLLDDLIDREEDLAAGAHNYHAYYRDGADVADRLDLLAHLAGGAIAPLRQRHRHAAILAGVAGFYLSDPAAESAYAAPARARLLRSAGPAVRPIVAVMRRRRQRRGR